MVQFADYHLLGCFTVLNAWFLKSERWVLSGKSFNFSNSGFSCSYILTSGASSCSKAIYSRKTTRTTVSESVCDAIEVD